MRYPDENSDHSRIRTCLFSLIGLLLVVLLFGAIWWNWVNAPPVVHVPTPKMPKPNAYDYYKAACNSVRDAGKIGFAAGNTSGNTSVGASPTDPDHVYSLTEKEALVRKNAAAIAKLREGFSHIYLNPPCRSNSAPVPELARFRNMARLLAVQAQARAGRRDWSGSINSCLDTLRLGTDIPHGGLLIHSFVGVAVQSIGRSEAWKAIHHLEHVQAEEATRRMEEIYASRASLASVMQEEKWMMQASFTDTMRQNNWFVLVKEFAQWGSTGARPLSYVKMPSQSKRGMLQANAIYMDKLITRANIPYAGRPPLPTMPQDPLNQMILPVFENTQFYFVRCDTQSALLLTAPGSAGV